MLAYTLIHSVGVSVCVCACVRERAIDTTNENYAKERRTYKE